MYIPCFICSADCYGIQNNNHNIIYCCKSCAIEIHKHLQFTHPDHKIPDLLVDSLDPKLGDGFPTVGQWTNIINNVKNIHNSVKKVIENKKYINECPCGMHPNQCDYHRGV
jgi:hypothetical protein